MNNPDEGIVVQHRVPQDSFGAMVQRAIDKGVPVETMERLLAMYEKLQARQAKAAFDAALASFQGECPTIAKTTKVLNKDGRSVRYRYAPLDEIVGQIKGLLQKHGFSYSVDAGMEPGFIRATCRVTHRLGHSEISSFAVPIDRDAFMNPAQKVASALTFAKRYAFCNGFGILTGDEDDDSRASHAEPAEQKAQAPKAPAIPTSKVATEKTRDWFLRQLCQDFEIGDLETWARKRGYLDGETSLENWPLAKVPTTRELVAKLKADLAEFINAKQQPTDKLTPQGQLAAFCTAAFKSGMSLRASKCIPSSATSRASSAAAQETADTRWRDATARSSSRASRPARATDRRPACATST